MIVFFLNLGFNQSHTMDEPMQPYSLHSSLPSNIAEFYRDRSIFITGATGFMGKVLVEKLLRSCPDIKTIYLLMRPKKGQDIHHRFTEEFHKHVVIAISISDSNSSS